MQSLDALIAPAFYEVHREIDNYTHFWLCGGRGSAKSSFASIEIILGMMKNPDANAVALRKVGAYLKDSVFAQLEWAVQKLGVADMWEIKPSVPEMIYKKTGQKILFRGADKVQKLKSTKVTNGYIRYIWYEELDEFYGMKEIRSINQSMMRGGEKFTVFYSYNPPANRRNWVNREAISEREDMLIHKSTYLDVPREWLGEQFFLEAEYLKKLHIDRYRHEYLGEVTGTGGEIFDNLEIRPITREEIDGFDNIKCGVDFGFAADPFVYLICFFHNNRLYIFDEIYAKGLTNNAAAERIMKKGYADKMIVCDSAEPKSINDLRYFGLRARGARKGPDSIEYGIKFLQGLEKIVIDSARCPNAAREFSEYELERDIDGEFRSVYPDKNNHSIDAVRYALEDEISRKKARIINRRDLNL
ncbi:MAG: PBSX family phage terminase large subunit [Oscillospiraceae bacterium]|nr:PBSX family phage terminase large subunit [Oscillospiraceae bacterium]